MIFVALLTWLVVGFAYCIMLAGLAWACIAAYRRSRLWKLSSNILLALLAGLLLGPPGCTLAIAQRVSETGEFIGDPLTESWALGYGVPFSIGFFGVFCIARVTGWNHGRRAKLDA